MSQTSDELNRDLEKARLWAWQWKMQFNADKTEEVIFSTKRLKPPHPPLHLGNEEVTKLTEHKHLGMILDSQLTFQSHIREAILKARRGIGIIRYLSKYVSRDVLDRIYNLYVRPHLDYGDIIYHKHDPDMKLDFTKRLEQTQYSAALAVTGAWRGTSRQGLYEELGWEGLYHRRWFRRLSHFYNLKKAQSPAYLFDEIPSERQLIYSLRNPHIYDQGIVRTNRFSNSYFQNVLSEWNLLNDDIKNSTTISEFKNRLLKMIRPVKNSIYNVFDISGIRCLTKLRLEFSELNAHRFRHNFDCLSPFCFCGMAKEDNEHFLLHCQRFDLMRIDLLRKLSDIPGLDVSKLNAKTLCEMLLYGNPHLSIIDNRIVLEATISFIESTKRLN